MLTEVFALWLSLLRNVAILTVVIQHEGLCKRNNVLQIFKKRLILGTFRLVNSRLATLIPRV